MNRARIAILAAIGIGLVTAVYFTHQPESETKVLHLSGNIEISAVEVSFKVPGRVVDRPVSEGETVLAGQLVARLDDAELAREVEIRRAELGAARAVLAELEAGSRPEEIHQARAALARAEAEADRTGKEHVRQLDLFRGDVISARELEAAEAANRIALAGVYSAESHLALLQRGPREEQIEQARESVRSASEAVALAEIRLRYAALTSPQAGLVLAEHVEPGEQVATGTPIVTVGDLENVWLRGYVDETDLGRVKAGQEVRVTTDTTPEKVFDGTVSFLASEAEFTPKSVETAKERVKLVYRVKIDIPNPTGELKPGMPADAEILLGEGGGVTP